MKKNQPIFHQHLNFQQRKFNKIESLLLKNELATLPPIPFEFEQDQEKMMTNNQSLSFKQLLTLLNIEYPKILFTINNQIKTRKDYTKHMWLIDLLSSSYLDTMLFSLYDYTREIELKLDESTSQIIAELHIKTDHTPLALNPFNFDQSENSDSFRELNILLRRYSCDVNFSKIVDKKSSKTVTSIEMVLPKDLLSPVSKIKNRKDNQI